MPKLYGPIVMAALLAGLLGGSVPAVSARAKLRCGPFLLAGLPSLGSVGWRCDASGLYALSFHAFPDSADDYLRFRAGAVTRTAHVQPGASVRLPFVNAHRQRLTLVQGTEPRTLRAFVRVYFAPGYSYGRGYLVPRVDVAIRPHFNY